jgi:diaminohydroxyphosphoribosylaminopyrimidine deaminase/5-amino-6-(5-phosphoribosylamino)uracil reductase
LAHDDSYIKLTLELAAKGKGRVSPNPLVGCVIVKNHQIIGAGYHEFFGGPHAEINALRNPREDVKGATLYVNLEPCSHFGKTPPCTDAIINAGISRVVIGTLDSNPLVSGKGAEKLTKSGIEVKTGVLENECLELNRFFFKFIQKRIPYVTVKVAQTLDGKIATFNNQSKWITTKASREEVHRMRASYDAVLIGRKTAMIDDPKLTVRLADGRDPKRVILDSKLRIDLKRSMFFDNQEQNIIIVTSVASKEKQRKIAALKKLGVKILFVSENKDGHVNLPSALRALGKENIMSVMVEGGQEIFSAFVREKLADELRIFISPKLLGKGLCAFSDMGVMLLEKTHRWAIRRVERFDEDVLLELRKT